jgi:hypothetical protein
MMFPPVTERAALYHRLLNQTMLVRTPTRLGERGHSFLYASANAVVRNVPPDAEIAREAIAFRAEMREALSPPGPASIVPADGNPDTIMAAVRQLYATGNYTTLLFEGYIADSANEQAPMTEAIDAEFSALGVRVIRPSGPVSDTWNNKTRFVNYVRELYGPEATPPGDVLPVTPTKDVAAMAQARMEPTGRAILKVTGFAGFGNLVVSRADVQDGSLDAKVAAFLERRPDVSEVRVEGWVTWNRTLCASFFVDETGEPTPMEVCSQLLTKNTGFLGGSSHTGLSLDDRQALQQLLMPFITKVAADGMRGFLAVDVILSDPSGRAGELRLPVSGQAVRLVEANLRINGHNQDRLFIAQLAVRHQRDADRMNHFKVGARPVGTRNRAECLALIAEALDGVAAPLGPRFETGSIYYVVTECLGEERAHRNDNVMFVGEDITFDRFESAAGCLRAQGLLKE